MLCHRFCAIGTCEHWIAGLHDRAGDLAAKCIGEICVARLELKQTGRAAEEKTRTLRRKAIVLG